MELATPAPNGVAEGLFVFATPAPNQVVEGDFVWIRGKADDSGREEWRLGFRRSLISAESRSEEHTSELQSLS